MSRRELRVPEGGKAVLSRTQKIAKARELRGYGKTAPEIAEILQAPASTVRNWYLGGDCQRCGSPVDGSSGSGSSRLCTACLGISRGYWTAARIIQAIQAWAAKHGAPPTATEFSQDDDSPDPKTVQRRFGSWSSGIRAAGFVPRKGQPRRGATGGRADVGQMRAER